jgi:hypothetical protein
MLQDDDDPVCKSIHGIVKTLIFSQAKMHIGMILLSSDPGFKLIALCI